MAAQRGSDAERRRWGPIAAPLVAGLLAAGAAFGAVVSLSDGGDEARPEERATTTAPDGRAVFARMGCGNCHRLAAANSAGGIGPDLDERLPGHTGESLRAKIVDPYPDLPPDAFTVMPDDYRSRMSAAELDALVSFLLAARSQRVRGSAVE